MAKRSIPNIPTRDTSMLSEWDLMFLAHVAEYGGMFNAHAHLCRASTLDPKYLRHMNTTPLDASKSPLPVKQDLVGDLHLGIAYTKKDLRSRMRRELERQIHFGVTRIDSNIDATPDLPNNGLLAIQIALELREEYRDLIDFRVGPTPIFGFKVRDGNNARFKTYKRASAISQFDSLLPEKDDFDPDEDPNGRIGFEVHIKKGLKLARKHGHEFQVHVDQMNLASERGTERLVETFKWFKQPVVKGSKGQPTVWAIHVISPSAYDEQRFTALIENLLRYNIGVIVCPSAGLSMRCVTSALSPTHNSLARVLELAYAGVPIRLGTDNIADVFVPPADGDMLTEVKMGAQALRLNSPAIWAKLACGIPLNNVDKAIIREILDENYRAARRIDPVFVGAVELLEQAS